MTECTFEKRWTNEEKTTYDIIQVYPEDRRVVVSESQDVYLAWLEEPNTPVEIDYVAPPVIPDPTVDELRAAAYNVAYTYDELCEALFENIKEGDSTRLDALQALRAQVKLDYPKE